jgi:hypothetical protein
MDITPIELQPPQLVKQFLFVDHSPNFKFHSPMSPDEFWQIVDRVHSLSPDDMETKCQNLDAALRECPLPDILDFIRHFARCFTKAYTWDLWAAAFIIGNGCGDDSFMDFRSTLISMGKEVFTNALADPETLADTNIHPDWAHFEGYQYVAPKLWREIVGESKEMPPDPNYPEATQKHPTEPAGRKFVEWKLSKKFPRLAAKFDFRDSSWFDLRDEQQKAAAKQTAAESLARLLLLHQLIPSSGLIPPFKHLHEVLKTGDARALTGRALTWETIDLEEGLYWATVAHLEGMPTQDLAPYPHITSTKLTHDFKINAANFADWYKAATA